MEERVERHMAKQVEKNTEERYIFHVDVNSAFLSWSALEQLKKDPGSVDLRTVPSAVGGDRKTRHGIITAKSIPAKKYGVETGEPVVKALAKCPGLILVPSDREAYKRYSKAFIAILHDFSSKVEQVSIDEAYMDVGESIDQVLNQGKYAGNEREAAFYLAGEIRRRVREELGFTVNVGMAYNKLLAKTASDFVKPDRTHSLWTEEIPAKFWPMPIGQLHGCGQATAQRLGTIGLNTIGETAHMDPAILRSVLGEKAGDYIYESCNGWGSTQVRTEREEVKGYSNETTTPYDINEENFEAAAIPLLEHLADKVAARMVKDGVYANTIGVVVKTDSFARRSRQMTLNTSTNQAGMIREYAGKLLRELLFGEKGLFAGGDQVRLIGVSATNLDDGNFRQMSLEDLFQIREMTAHESITKEIISEKRPTDESKIKQAAQKSNEEKRGKTFCKKGQSKTQKKESTEASSRKDERKDPAGDPAESDKSEKLQKMMRAIRGRYGDEAVSQGWGVKTEDTDEAATAESETLRKMNTSERLR